MKPSAVILALTMAGLAIGGSASASHQSNTSSVDEWFVGPRELPGPGGFPPFANVQLRIQTSMLFAHPGDKPQGGFLKTLTLMFDDDIKFDLAGVPSCTATFGPGTTIAKAWERCGPGADTPPEVNALLSMPTGGTTGTVSTAPPSNYGGCAFVFKRGSSPDRVLVFMRVFTTPNSVPNCSNPAANTAGNTSRVLTGTGSNAGMPGLGTKVTIPGFDTLTWALDSAKVILRRGSVFQARCREFDRLLRLRATFTWSGTGQPPDTWAVNRSCT